MQSLTIFTPTYNRAGCLQRLYHSLLQQTCRDFIWLVVDDGSTDETLACLRRWQQEELLALYWVRTPNGGKHRAHNLGVQMTNTELFLCVDSDDSLPADAVGRLLSHWRRYGNGNLAGVIAYKQHLPNGSTGGRLYTQQPASLRSFYQNGLWGDAALCYRTQLLREHPFPEIEGETFVTEHYVYAQIDRDYPLLPLRHPLIRVEYRPDGYSQHALELLQQNPKGWMLYHLQCAQFAQTASERRRQLWQYVCYAVLGGEKRVFSTCIRLKMPSAWPLGLLLFCKRRLQYRRYQKKNRGGHR